MPAMPNDERRPGREVEHRERNDRSSQRTRDPREDRQHAPERQRGLRAEQRPPAPDRAQDQRQHAEAGRQIVTPEDQQHQRAADEDDHLQQPPEVDPGPPVDPRRPGTPAIEIDDSISGGVVHGPGQWTPHAEAILCSPQIRARAPGSFALLVGGPMIQRPSRWPGPACPVLCPAPPPDSQRATASTDDRLPEMFPDVRRTREEVDLRRGIGRECRAGARRPQIGSNQRDFEEDVEKREDDDGDHAPGGAGNRSSRMRSGTGGSAIRTRLF